MTGLLIAMKPKCCARKSHELLASFQSSYAFTLTAFSPRTDCGSSSGLEHLLLSYSHVFSLYYGFWFSLHAVQAMLSVWEVSQRHVFMPIIARCPCRVLTFGRTAIGLWDAARRMAGCSSSCRLVTRMAWDGCRQQCLRIWSEIAQRML